MSEKIAVSKPSFNVLTTTEPNNLIYSSDYNTLKYYAQGSLNIIVDYSNYYGTVADFFAGTLYAQFGANTVPHNLGYTPFFTGYTNFFSASATQYNMLPGYFADAGVSIAVGGYADGTNLYFEFNGLIGANTGFATATVLYKIFRNDTGL